jgi:hypothetical protein
MASSQQSSIWAGLALVAEQVRDDLEAVCGVLKTEAPALQARQTCLKRQLWAEAELHIRSQGDNGIDARGAARWEIYRQQHHGCQRS